MCVCISICVYVIVYIWMCMYVYMYLSIYLCIYLCAHHLLTTCPGLFINSGIYLSITIIDTIILNKYTNDAYTHTLTISSSLVQGSLLMVGSSWLRHRSRHWGGFNRYFSIK
jgi:hypothetical protein